MLEAETSGHRRVARHALNRLILACEEDILAESDAQNAVRDTTLLEHLRAQALQRVGFVDELRHAVMLLGGGPAMKASGPAWLRSIGRHLRALVGGWHEGDAYAALVRTEQRTAGLYLVALSGWLPDDARFGLQGQLARISSDLEESQQLRGRH